MKPDLRQSITADFILCCLLVLAACAKAVFPSPDPAALPSPNPSLTGTSPNSSTGQAAVPGIQTATLTPTAEFTDTLHNNYYESTRFGLRLIYPVGFQVEEFAAPPGIALQAGFAFPEDILDSEVRPALALTIYENQDRQDLVGWFAAHQGELPEAGPDSDSRIFFYSPNIKFHSLLKGMPAIQYESSYHPVTFETLLERDAYVIGLSYQRDSRFDYGPIYEEMLISMEFFEPLEEPEPVTPTPLPAQTRP